MKAQFWGVRGYVPTPGAAFLRYGGNTCCVSLRGADGELLVLDSGTGFCQLGAALMADDFQAGRGELTLLITHTYWDHFLGLPFPGIVHIPGNQLRIYGPDSARGPLEMIYDNMLAPVYSPVFGLAHIAATHSFHPISSEPFQVGQLTVRGMPLSRRAQSPIWAYRVEEAGRALVYITDARYTDDAIWREAVHFARDAEVLIHSAPYLRGEAVRDYGHSRVEDAIELALEAGVRRLYLYHHAPTRTDDDLDALVARCRGELAADGQRLDLDAAREGEIVEV